MRKLLSLLFLVFSLYACNTGPQYTINGTIENYEGYIFLRYGEYVDSTLVDNGQFHFSGNVDHVVNAAITNAADGLFIAQFYMENETVEISTIYEEPYIQLKEVQSPSSNLMATILEDLGAVYEDVERLRSNEMFLYMDSITQLYPRNEFVTELTTEVITSDFITMDQANDLLTNIDTTLLDYYDLQSLRTSLSRMERLNAGDKFPAFSFEGLNGEVFTNESFPNQYLLIDIWATWCGPCTEGFKKLIPIREEFDGQLEIIAVSIDPSKDRWTNYLSKNELPWKHAFIEGEFENPFMVDLGVVFLPFYYLLSPEGEVLAINPKTEEIADLIKRKANLREVMK